MSRRIDEKRARPAEAFIAQRYEFGDRFEYDFGEARLYIGGRLRRIQMAVMVACASDARFALLYENQRQDVFLDSQVRFFEFMGGTFREGAYDNMVRACIHHPNKIHGPGVSQTRLSKI